MKCQTCGRELSRILGLVKDGSVYEANRCPDGHYALVDRRLDHLPVAVESRDGVHQARFLDGGNWYIFDRRLFREALRPILKLLRSRPGDLVLDLTPVGFVGEPLLTAIRFVDNGLRRRGHVLRVITRSAVVTTEMLKAAPALAGRVFSRSEEALAAAFPQADAAPGASPA